MAENIFNPTAANILSSLKIKGATAVGGPGKDGYVPILGEDGKLDLSIVPVDTIQSLLDVPALKSVAFVDGKTEMAVQTGSIAAPFSTLASAAAASVDADSSGDSGPVDRYLDFVLMSGDYGSENVGVASGSRKRVRVFGLGSANFSNLTFRGYSGDTVFELYNVNVSETLQFDEPGSCQLLLAGNSSIGRLATSDPESELTVHVGADCTVGESAIAGTLMVEYVAKASKVANDSETVTGKAVSDALDSLGTRKIRIPVFSTDSSGLCADSADDVEVSEDGTLYSLTRIGTSLAEAVNGTFHKDGDSPVYGEVQADKVVADGVEAGAVATEMVKFTVNGAEKAILKVSTDNFLEIA